MTSEENAVLMVVINKLAYLFTNMNGSELSEKADRV